MDVKTLFIPLIVCMALLSAIFLPVQASPPEDPSQITLFEQNYSRHDSLPQNIFLERPYRGDLDEGLKASMFQVIYHSFKSAMETGLDLNTTEGIEYTTSLNAMGLLTFWPMRFVGTTVPLPLSHWYGQNEQKFDLLLSDPCYVSGLVPMVRCAYHLTIGMEGDSQENYAEIYSPGARVLYQIRDDGTARLTSTYLDPSGDLHEKSLVIPESGDQISFQIIYDGVQKTNTIYYSEEYQMTTPFYDPEQRMSPYPEVSNGWMKWNNHIGGPGRGNTIFIYAIAQTADRDLVTPIGYNQGVPFGLDGPHPIDTVDDGLSYVIARRGACTLWCDRTSIEEFNETELEYIRDLVANRSFEVGIHFSKQLNEMPLEDAYDLMEEEYQFVAAALGTPPTSWCSLRNDDNITHAIHAYEQYGMIWRNGASGIRAEDLGGVGNLEDTTWHWWETASGFGMISPSFSHQIDESPAIRYSISKEHFERWVDNYRAHSVSIMPFARWWKINSNTYEATVSDITSDPSGLEFTISTNGYESLVNVDLDADESTVVHDVTADMPVEWEYYHDGSLVFWVEDAHTYQITTPSSAPLEGRSPPDL